MKPSPREFPAELCVTRPANSQGGRIKRAVGACVVGVLASLRADPHVHTGSDGARRCSGLLSSGGQVLIPIGAAVVVAAHSGWRSETHLRVFAHRSQYEQTHSECLAGRLARGRQPSCWIGRTLNAGSGPPLALLSTE